MSEPTPDTVELRREAEVPAIRHAEEQAFNEDDEARVVEMLSASGRATLSLVALVDGQVVGHVLFSPLTVEDTPVDLRWVALGPIGVLPRFQGRGIGSRLVRGELDGCRSQCFDGIVLVGDPGYYGRFGFVPTGDHGLTCVYGDGPAFQLEELREGALERVSGMVRLSPEFDEFARDE